MSNTTDEIRKLRHNERHRRYYQKVRNDPSFKERKAEYDKRYREKNREKRLEQRRLYYKEHTIQDKEKSRRNYFARRDYYRGRCKERTITRRLKLLEILGDICIKCGFNDVRILQFDHINGGGHQERLMKFHGDKMVRYYLEHPEEAKERLQVMCPNCNWLKRVEKNENGHYIVLNTTIL